VRLLVSRDESIVRELFETLEAGNADGRAAYGRASWIGIALRV
jgi:hypothetical protein